MSKTFLCAQTLACAVAVVAGVVPGLSRAAATVVLDDFSTPPSQSNLLTDHQDFVTTDTGTFAGEPGQWRSAYYAHYYPTATTATSSTATLVAGGVSVAAAPGEIGELAFGYGNAARGGGENGHPLDLDLSRLNDLRVTFANLQGPVNLLVGFYSSVPGSDGLYYWNGEENYTPAQPGGPATVDLLFKGRDQYQSGYPPVYRDPSRYDFADVDGIVFIVDRAAQSTGNDYTITNLSFTSAVPEPSEWVMSSVAVGLLGWLARRRRA